MVLGSGEKQALRSRLADAEAMVRTLQAQLDERRYRDELTRLFTHDAFRTAACGELQRADRDDKPVALALVDVDGFRALNASRGADAGDVALRSVALRLRRLTRASDVLGRTGADEMSVLMPGTDLHGAQACCERLIDELEAADLPGAGYVTVSAGIALHLPGGSLDDLLMAAALGVRRARSLGGARTSTSVEEGVQVANPAHTAVVEALAVALLERDRYTGEHSESVVDMARTVARTLGLDELETDRIGTAALLHDIGKVAIPDRILNKPSPLDDAEWELMREHPVIGERILRAIPGMGAVARIVRHEHERWDGGGYPDRLRGEEIPIGSRIILACDTYSAMTTTRPYRQARSHGEAIAELARCAGSQFDPRVTEALIGSLYWMTQSDLRTLTGQ